LELLLAVGLLIGYLALLCLFVMSAYKKQIFDEIVKKYDHAKKQKKELDEKVKIYEDFLKEINPQAPNALTIDLSKEIAV